MCQFKSAIVTRQGEILDHWATDSHEDLVELFGLRDTGLDQFCRVEFYPDDMRDVCDVEKYKLHIDESETPAWFEEYREKVVESLSRKVSAIIIKDKTVNMLIGCAAVLGDGAVITKCTNAIIKIMVGSSRVGTMRGSSRVGTMRESSQVGTMRESSQVGTMRGSSQVGEMWGSSQVGTMRESSQVGEMLGSSQVGKDNRDKEPKS